MVGKDESKGDKMKVYIFCKRYVDLEKGLLCSKIVSVYEDAEFAYKQLEEKQNNNDYNWYIVVKSTKKNQCHELD